jgi:hypothetical protein
MLQPYKKVGRSGADVMTLEIPTSALLQFHVAISLVGILTGFIVVYGLLKGRPPPFWTAMFLVTTILTSVTGFPLPPFGFDPPRAFGIISLVLLAFAVASLYVFHLAGIWRWIYIGSAITALYLNVLVGITQTFQKVPFLNALAPTQSEPPFVIVQLVVLTIFVALGVLAVMRFHPAMGATSRV